VIVDCDVSGAPNILKYVRNTPTNSRALTFAIVNREDGLHSAFELGANLALQKPISVDRARSSLRAAYGLIMQERRRYFRVQLDIAVRLSPNERTQFLGTTMNISEGGLALRCNEELSLHALLKTNFLLPGDKAEIELRAVVVWKDTHGHAGLRFDQVSATNRQKINDWLAEQATFL
jgi:PilZ domain